MSLSEVTSRGLVTPAEQSGMPGDTRMRLRYGVNQADACSAFALGPHREHIRQRLCEIDTRLVRLFLFDKGGPDPVQDWSTFAAYVQAVLDLGAVPMTTFAKFHRPFDDPRALRWFAARCSDVVWGCVDRWGGEVVRDWYWCVWNEPNSAWIGGGLSFEQYRRIYEAVAEGVVRSLAPHLDGRRPRIGGPAVDTFQPFWMDWVWRFVNEIDNELIGFVDWHSYGDWRDHGEDGAPSNPSTHRELIMARAFEYESRGLAIARLLEGRSILNICGELNAQTAYWEEVRTRFNHTVFAAAFYAAALVRLMRAGADAEMFWTGTEDSGGYGMMTGDGSPAPSWHAKRLCAGYVRHGDWISFPEWERSRTPVDAVLARGNDGRRSILLVHLASKAAAYDLQELRAPADWCETLLKIDEGTGSRVVRLPFQGKVFFDGYGVAVLTGGTEPRDENP